MRPKLTARAAVRPSLLLVLLALSLALIPMSALAAGSATVSGAGGETVRARQSIGVVDDQGNASGGVGQATMTLQSVALMASMTLTGSPTSIAEPGGGITYTATVSNGSAVPITITGLHDSIIGALGGDDDCKVGTSLAVYGSCGFQFTAAVSGHTGTVSRTVHATAVDGAGNGIAPFATASVTVTDVPSTISATYIASPSHILWPGGDADFTVTVTNTSPVDAVTITALQESILGDLNGNGDCVTPQTLPAGGSYSCTASAFVSGSVWEVQSRTLAVAGIDDDGVALSASADLGVPIAGPRVQFRETISFGGFVDGEEEACRVLTLQVLDMQGAPAAHAGVPVGFTLAKMGADAYILEDTDGGNYVATSDADGTVTITLCATLPGSVEVTAWVDYDQDGEYDSTPSGVCFASECLGASAAAEPFAWARVWWEQSGLVVVKTASPAVIHSGDEVTYTYRVSHAIADGALYDVGLLDDNGTPGDPSDDQVIALTPMDDLDGGGDDLLPGTLATGSYTVTVTADTTNVATVTGTGRAGVCEGDCTRDLSASDDASVDVIAPAIALTYTPSTTDLAAEGGEVTYTYVITNAGDTPLGSVVVADDTCTAISGPTHTSGNGDDLLEVGETWTYQCSRTVSVTSTSAASATGTDQLGLAVSAQAAATVTVAETATAVTVRDWQVVGGADGATITWVTLMESDVQAFRLYRSATSNVAGAVLAASVPAQGSVSGGHEQAYQYVDGGLGAGQYWYWLAEQTGQGEHVVAGPTGVVVGVSDQAMREKVFVPLLLVR